mmetsp:Transcript_93180/g.299935  ORF Transcript_93180/g.299935 Transcript_93180/m.299935 type:complete len:98 (-) Transcript_93180:210-503(-)
MCTRRNKDDDQGVMTILCRATWLACYGRWSTQPWDECWSPERDNGGNDRPALGSGKVKLLSTQNIAHARRAANKNWRDDRIGRRELVEVDAPQTSKP